MGPKSSDKYSFKKRKMTGKRKHRKVFLYKKMGVEIEEVSVQTMESQGLLASTRRSEGGREGILPQTFWRKPVLLTIGLETSGFPNSEHEFSCFKQPSLW